MVLIRLNLFNEVLSMGNAQVAVNLIEIPRKSCIIMTNTDTFFTLHKKCQIFPLTLHAKLFREVF